MYNVHSTTCLSYNRKEETTEQRSLRHIFKIDKVIFQSIQDSVTLLSTPLYMNENIFAYLFSRVLDSVNVTKYPCL